MNLSGSSAKVVWGSGPSRVSKPRNTAVELMKMHFWPLLDEESDEDCSAEYKGKQALSRRKQLHREKSLAAHEQAFLARRRNQQLLEERLHEMEESEGTENEKQAAVEEKKKKLAAEKKKRAEAIAKKKLMLQQELKPKDPRCASLTHVLPSYATLKGTKRILTSVEKLEAKILRSQQILKELESQRKKKKKKKSARTTAPTAVARQSDGGPASSSMLSQDQMNSSTSKKLSGSNTIRAPPQQVSHAYFVRDPSDSLAASFLTFSSGLLRRKTTSKTTSVEATGTKNSQESNNQADKSKKSILSIPAVGERSYLRSFDATAKLATYSFGHKFAAQIRKATKERLKQEESIISPVEEFEDEKTEERIKAEKAARKVEEVLFMNTKVKPFEDLDSEEEIAEEVPEVEEVVKVTNRCDEPSEVKGKKAKKKRSCVLLEKRPNSCYRNKYDFEDERTAIEDVPYEDESEMFRKDIAELEALRLDILSIHPFQQKIQSLITGEKPYKPSYIND